MPKRLKDIVLYILENTENLGLEERARLDEMREQLRSQGYAMPDLMEIVEQLMSVAREGEQAEEVRMTVLTGEARNYLERIVLNGLLSSDQEDEVLARAGRLFPEGLDLADAQFLVASLIFDENLVNDNGGELFTELEGTPFLERRRPSMH